MLGQQLATILAQTDPFDLSQGIERYVRSLSGEQARFVISAARPAMNEGYRAEFVPLLDEPDDERLKSAFIHSLKSNLRALPLFGPAFCEGVIAQVPGDRAVAMGEEGYSLPQVRPVAIGIIALVLLIAGAAGEHVWSTARANSETPVVLVTPAPMQTAAARRIAVAARPAATAVPQTAPPATQGPAPPTPQPATAAPTQAPVAATPVPHVRPTPVRTPPPGSGVKTIIAVERTPRPTPQPTDMDLSDMPKAFTDATPLPKAEAPPTAEVSTPTQVATPSPGPNRSWTHRLVHTGVNLVNGTLNVIGVSKKATPAPTSSPAGPQPR